jgi:hypothetical protein
MLRIDFRSYSTLSNDLPSTRKEYRRISRTRTKITADSYYQQQLSFPISFHRIACVNIYILNSHSGVWSPIWVHSATSATNWPIVTPRLIVRMENFVELRLVGETGALGENLPQRHFVHHKCHLTRSGLEPEPPRWKFSDKPPELWRGQVYI